MQSLIDLEKSHGYIIAAVVTVAAAVMAYYGYERLASSDTYTGGMVMIVVAVVLALLSWYGAYAYAS